MQTPKAIARLPLLRGLLWSRATSTWNEARGTNGLVPEASGEAVHRAGEPLRARHVALEEGELPAARGSQHRDGYADEPHGLRQPDPGEERLDPAVDGEPVVRRIPRLRPRDRREVGEAELEGDGASGVPARAQLARHTLALAPERRSNERDVERVVLEGLLGAHGLRRTVRLDRPVVETSRELQEIGPVRSEAGLQMRGGNPGELSDRVDPHGEQLSPRHFAHAPQPPHGQR